MKIKKKTALIICIFLAVIIVVFGIGYLNKVNRYHKTVAGITYSGIDISDIPDGVYIGECDVDFVYAKVEVTVKDKAITKIDLLEHKNGRGEAAEGLEQRIVEQQRIDVDSVSGATSSSKVIKKAVDNALNRIN
ncbi:MAG: FMN-binding protein [Oscillospiraceae bacterium]|nr:FMN-binding protein [Oscillospiraceae bacterium]